MVKETISMGSVKVELEKLNCHWAGGAGPPAKPDRLAVFFRLIENLPKESS